MWVAGEWKDYEVLDTSSGEKLERFGDYILIRPDPQVIWESEKKNPYWEKFDGYYHRSKSGGGEWENKNLPEAWQISYKDICFNLKPFGFKHTGVFPEQAVNWDFMQEKIRTCGFKPNILNLFAYTGGATLACAKAGASVCHVDAAKGIVSWAKENAASSDLANAQIRYIVDDCIKFVEREIRRGKKYDGIIMDPPSYGRGPSGEIWKLEEKLYSLVALCQNLLSDTPLFFVLNSYTTGLSAGVSGYLLGLLIQKKFGGRVFSDELALPVNNGLFLPCGTTARWEAAEWMIFMEEIIKVCDLSFCYQREDPDYVIKNLSLTIKNGEFVAILGHNGSGKSTLAKHFNAVLLPVSGKVFVHGTDTANEELLFEIRRRTGMVFQNPDNQIVATMVEEDVAFGPENLGLPSEEIREQVQSRLNIADDALEAVGMSKYKNHAPHLLSGGQKQRVAIAGVLAMRPDCIVLDEPTAMLDPVGRRDVLKTIKKLNKDLKITVVLITHGMDEAAMADRVIVMNKGEIIEEGTPYEVFQKVEKLKSVRLDVPQTTELIYNLRAKGFSLPENVLTVEECADAIEKLLGERHK